MKKFLLVSALAAMSLSSFAAVDWYCAYHSESYYFDETGAVKGGGLSSGTSKSKLMTAQADGTYKATFDIIWFNNGGVKFLNKDADEIAKVKAEYVADFPTWNPGEWHTQWGASSQGGGLMSTDPDDSPVMLTNFIKENKTFGYAPGEVLLKGGLGVLRNATIVFDPSGAAWVEKCDAPKDEDYLDYGICNAENAWKAPEGKFLFKHEGKGIYTMTYDFGEEEGVKNFKIRPYRPVAVYGFAAEGNTAFGLPVVEETPAEATRAEAEEITEQYLTSYHKDSDNKRDAGNPSMTAKSTTIAHSIKANVTGVYDLYFDSNTGLLRMTKQGSSAVSEIAADENAPVEYFNMQGMKVANPENGIFVRRQGKKVSKVVIK